MTIERFPILPGEAGRAEWLARRATDITASVVGALLTEHPYVTPLRLWAAQRGTEFEVKPENKRMRRGRKLERLVGEEVEELRPTWQVTPVGHYYRDPELRLGATPDFWILGDERGTGVLQAKTAGPDVIAKQWDAGRVPPPWIQWQLVCEMLLTDAAFGAIAVLDPFNWDCHIIEFERDPAPERLLTTMVREFWRLVELGIEPTVDLERDTATIKALHPLETPGKIVDLSGSNELREMLEARAVMLDSIKAYKARCEVVENQLRLLLRDAEQVAGLDGWKITYKTEHVAEYTVKEKNRRVLRILDKREIP